MENISHKIGQIIETTTQNLFEPFVVTLSKDGISVPLPTKFSGHIVEINEKNKDGYTVGVSFTLKDFHGKKQEVTLFLKPRNINTMTQ